jgi:hypothetical protein
VELSVLLRSFYFDILEHTAFVPKIIHLSGNILELLLYVPAAVVTEHTGMWLFVILPSIFTVTIL